MKAKYTINALMAAETGLPTTKKSAFKTVSSPVLGALNGTLYLAWLEPDLQPDETFQVALAGRRTDLPGHLPITRWSNYRMVRKRYPVLLTRRLSMSTMMFSWSSGAVVCATTTPFRLHF